MLGYITLFFTLLACWIIFSGYLDIFFISCGVVSCLIAVYYSHKMSGKRTVEYPIFLHPKAILYFLWLIKEIFISSFDVALRMWQPKPDISPTLSWIKSSQKTAVGKATYANSITLTPGTVCIEVDGDDMCIHALSASGITDLKSGVMDKKVTKVTG